MANIKGGDLRRVMGPFGALLLTLAVLSPGLGVFIVGNDMLHQAGSGTIACLLAATGLGAAVAALYAELGSAFPHAGAEYTLAGRLLGSPAGFAMLAVYLVALPIGMAVSGLGIADYLGDIFPGLGERQMAVPAILAAVLIAACSIRLNATVTGLLVAAEVAALDRDLRSGRCAYAGRRAAPIAAPEHGFGGGRYRRRALRPPGCGLRLGDLCAERLRWSRVLWRGDQERRSQRRPCGISGAVYRCCHRRAALGGSVDGRARSGRALSRAGADPWFSACVRRSGEHWPC